MSKDDETITATKIYFPDEKSIKVNQSWAQICPFNFPAGYHWFGNKQTSPGHTPKWVDKLMTEDGSSEENELDEVIDSDSLDQDNDGGTVDGKRGGQ